MIRAHRRHETSPSQSKVSFQWIINEFLACDLDDTIDFVVLPQVKIYHYQSNLRSCKHSVKTNPISLTRFKFISISIYLFIFVPFAFDDKTDKYKHCFIEFQRE